MAGHICIRNFHSKSLKESGGQTENRKIKEVNSELGKVGEGGAMLELKNINVSFQQNGPWDGEGGEA